MPDRIPDFYLASAEHRGAWATPRNCRVTARLHTEHKDECVMVEVDPPILGQPLGIGDGDLWTLLLAPRQQGTRFPERVTMPLAVLIYRLLKPGVGKQRIARDADLRFSTWGEIYPSHAAALAATHTSKKTVGPPVKDL